MSSTQCITTTISDVSATISVTSSCVVSRNDVDSVVYSVNGGLVAGLVIAFLVIAIIGVVVIKQQRKHPPKNRLQRRRQSSSIPMTNNDRRASAAASTGGADEAGQDKNAKLSTVLEIKEDISTPTSPTDKSNII